MADDDDVKDGDKDKKKDPSTEELVQALRFIAQKQVQQDLKFTELIEKMEGLGTPPDDKKPAPIVKDADEIDAMSNSELMAHAIKESVSATRTELIEPLMERFGSAENRLDTNVVKGDIKNAMDSYTDFATWQKEIKDTLEKQPDLSIDDAYHLAKGRNPEKVAELNKAVAEEAAKVVAEERKTKEMEYGGLLPTSGLAAKNEGMSQQEAAEAAYDEIIGNTPFEQQLNQ